MFIRFISLTAKLIFPRVKNDPVKVVSSPLNVVGPDVQHSPVTGSGSWLQR